MEDVLALKTKNVAGNIRKIREYRDYTQDYLAAKLKISQNAYSKIELGYSKLTVDRLFQISTILEVEVTHLLTLNHNDLIKIIAEDESRTAAVS
ncbi:transcriptional regulator [Pedobacter sp. Leaf41]|jgi:transcriptional regulator with XRE-family HTH domain|uniref:helix-turn-helix domain-containing protein n=1 Tax=Pedobacter sp. Leaf41 TaxID=1736218 RepID=UPI0007025AF2|nr:helix-turn-helix transcriptional regulator [Pedobacter sp. Leaf41]KQN34556.1 transcriptional regulator [Pedobacter sp. Leaf41]RZL62217.1 MAG: XRE family transcriptional regulator [Pedobacter sp.]